MALFELLFSSLLFSLVCSAPVDVTTTQATEETHVPVPTVSGSGKDLRASPTPEVLTSSVPGISKVPPKKQDDLASVPHTPGKQASPPSYVLPLQKSSKPAPHAKSVSRPKAAEKKEHVQAESDSQEEVSTTEAPEILAIKQAIRALRDDHSKISVVVGSHFPQQPTDSQPEVRVPSYKHAFSLPEEPDISPQVPYSEEVPIDIGVPEEPLEQRQEQGPKDEAVFLVDVSPLVQEEAVPQPSEPSSEKSLPESIPRDDQPQDAVEEDPSQVDGADEGIGPAQFVPPKETGPFDDPSAQREDDRRDQSDSPQEPPYPVVVDLPEEVVGVRIPPGEDEKEPAVVLMGEDLVAPVLPVQEAAQYDAAEIVPLSVEPAGEEPPEEPSDDPALKKY